MKTVATIGSFDGVHSGHQYLLKQVRHIADELGGNAMAVTFGASPKKVLKMDDTPQLNTTDERTTLLRQAGIDEVILLDFTPQMATMTAHEFMQQVLKEQLHVEVLVIGYDHRFGKGRSEGFNDYVRYGKEIGIEVVSGEACMSGGAPISSTRIRCLLNEGKVDEATSLLGYRYVLQGEVISGYQEGRKLGFPTANINPLNTDKVVPADGVYAVWVAIGEDSQPKAYGPRLKGMLNIGYRPTLNNGRERSIEVHILDFEGDLYGKSIKVEFVCRLRDELPFDSLNELTIQLQKDRERVSEMLDVKE